MLVKNSIRVVCSPSYKTAFIPHKDISLPLVIQPFSKPSPPKGNIKDRTILGYWAGICNSDVRNRLVKENELDVQNNTRSPSHRKNKFYSAKFCICPRGSRMTTSRITMAIHYGCVPVILADYFDLPFKDVLDWQKFSVILKERDVYRLKRVLKAKAGEEFKRLHSNLVKVQKHFRWNTPPVKYDSFHISYNLWLRRNVIKYSDDATDTTLLGNLGVDQSKPLPHCLI